MTKENLQTEKEWNKGTITPIVEGAVYSEKRNAEALVVPRIGVGMSFRAKLDYIKRVGKSSYK